MGLPEEGLLLGESRASSFVREGMKAPGVRTDITKTKMGHLSSKCGLTLQQVVEVYFCLCAEASVVKLTLHQANPEANVSENCSEMI